MTIRRTLRRSWMDLTKEQRMSVCSDRSCASSMMITLYLGGREERRLLAEFVVHHGFAQQHSVGDELDVGVGTRAVVETDAVTDLSAHLAPALLSDSLCDGDGCNTTRLRDSNHAISTPERMDEDELE